MTTKEIEEAEAKKVCDELLEKSNLPNISHDFIRNIFVNAFMTGCAFTKERIINSI